MKFEEILPSLRTGSLAARMAWDSHTNRYIYFVRGSRFNVNRAPLSEILPFDAEVEYTGHIDIHLGSNTFTPWVATHEDLLADDWFIAAPTHTEEKIEYLIEE